MGEDSLFRLPTSLAPLHTYLFQPPHGKEKVSYLIQEVRVLWNSALMTKVVKVKISGGHWQSFLCSLSSPEHAVGHISSAE